jgi:ribosomal protein S9
LLPEVPEAVTVLLARKAAVNKVSSDFPPGEVLSNAIPLELVAHASGPLKEVLKKTVAIPVELTVKLLILAKFTLPARDGGEMLRTVKANRTMLARAFIVSTSRQLRSRLSRDPRSMNDTRRWTFKGLEMQSTLRYQ